MNLATVLLATLGALQSAPSEGDVGLLLSVRHGPFLDSPASYRTVWVTSSGGRAEKGGEWPQVIVPHDGGFCTVDVKHFEGERNARTAVGVRCNGEDLEPPPASDMEMSGCEGWDLVDILFASSEYVSIERRVSGHCFGRVNYYSKLSTARLSDYARQWTFRHSSTTASSVFGSEALILFREAARAECIRFSAMGPYDGSLPMPSCNDELVPIDFTNWAVKRAGGRWRIIGRIQGWRNNFTDYVLPFALSSSVVPAAAESRDETFAAAMPSAPDDVLLSPDGTFAAGVDRPQIRFYWKVGSELRESSLAIPFGIDERVVLIEWALGEDVVLWNERLLKQFGAAKDDVK